MSNEPDEVDASRAPLMDHLIELRRRLLWCIGALLIGFGIAFTQAARIFDFLVRPLAQAFGPGQHKLIYTKLYEAFFVDIKVALFAGFVLAFPVIANQLWAFVAPGLYKREKAAFLPFLIATPVLFTMGASLAYFVVMPTAFRFFLGFQHVGSSGLAQEALPAIGDYLSLVMQFIIAFGVAFLLPVLLMLLERAGIINRQQLIKSRRYAIVGATIVAAVLAPPDVWSQIALAVPLVLLYEISIIGIWLPNAAAPATPRGCPPPRNRRSRASVLLGVLGGLRHRLAGRADILAGAFDGVAGGKAERGDDGGGDQGGLGHWEAPRGRDDRATKRERRWGFRRSL